jgi:type VI secretion system secreted protein VgrG
VVTTVVAAVAVTQTAASSAASVERQAEYVQAKNFCDTPPPPGGNECATLSSQIDHAKKCINLYEAWDSKWFPGRHSDKIQTWTNRLDNLKAEHKQKCTNKCP